MRPAKLQEICLTKGLVKSCNVGVAMCGHLTPPNLPTCFGGSSCDANEVPFCERLTHFPASWIQYQEIPKNLQLGQVNLPAAFCLLLSFAESLVFWKCGPFAPRWKSSNNTWRCVYTWDDSSISFIHIDNPHSNPIHFWLHLEDLIGQLLQSTAKQSAAKAGHQSCCMSCL